MGAKACKHMPAYTRTHKAWVHTYVHVCAHVLMHCSHVQARVCTYARIPVHPRMCMFSQRLHAPICTLHVSTRSRVMVHTHMHARSELQYLSGLREVLHMQASRCRASCAGFLGNSYFSFLPFLEPVLGLLLNLPFTVPSPLYCPLQASPPHFGCCF